MAYVYILKNSEGSFYIGSTADIKRRLRQHFSGHTQTTRNRKYTELVFVQQFDSLERARKIERKLKRWKRKDYIEKIVKDGYIKAV